MHEKVVYTWDHAGPRLITLPPKTKHTYIRYFHSNGWVTETLPSNHIEVDPNTGSLVFDLLKPNHSSVDSFTHYQVIAVYE